MNPTVHHTPLWNEPMDMAAPVPLDRGQENAQPLYPSAANAIDKFAPPKNLKAQQKRAEVAAARAEASGLKLPSWTSEPPEDVRGGAWAELGQTKNHAVPKPRVGKAMPERMNGCAAYVDGTPVAGISSSDYEKMYGYSATGLKMRKDGWGRSVHR